MVVVRLRRKLVAGGETPRAILECLLSDMNAVEKMQVELTNRVEASIEFPLGVLNAAP